MQLPFFYIPSQFWEKLGDEKTSKLAMLRFSYCSEMLGRFIIVQGKRRAVELSKSLKTADTLIDSRDIVCVK